MKLKSSIKTLTLASVFLIGLCVGQAQATVIAYTGGHAINESAANAGDLYLASGVSNTGSGTSDTAVAATLASSGSYDAYVLGEGASSLSSTARTLISDWTLAGGNTVVLGSHGAEAALLNDIFGTSVSVYAGAACASCNDSISKLAGDGPDSLLGLNGSWFIDSAPGTVLYERDAGGVAGFVMDYGLGTVSWLAWDFCECGNLDASETAWYSVLGTSAVNSGGIVGGNVSVPEPTTLAIFGLGLLGLVGKRRNNSK